jgi:1,4-alpha-glucan branching enzyme
MATVPVRFTYFTGVVGDVFPGVRARLHGSWNRDGRYSDHWSITDMAREAPGVDSASFRASVDLDAAEQGRWFHWGVSFVAPDGRETWAIPTEVKDRASRERYRSFQFSGQAQDEEYYFVHCTRLGANKFRHPDGSTRLRFDVWAPNAQAVEVVMGKIWDQNDPDQNPANGSVRVPDIAGGYIADDGTGSHPTLGPFPMQRTRDAVWETNLDDPRLHDFSALDHKPYMYRITRNDGSVAYRTDLYSRCQIGRGSFDPEGTRYTGLISDLDGTVSCSVVVDPEKVTKYFREEPPYLTEPAGVAAVWPEREFVSDAEFWADEFGARKPPPRVEDLIIYELHTGALGFGKPETPGTLEDAIALLDYLIELGVNAVELLPLSEFGRGGSQNWGYSTSHFCAVEYSGGGRDQYKFFVKEAHKRGLAVIMDVVYNHYAHHAERAQSMYDAVWPDRNAYYWYEGTPFNYARPDGGYVDNMSTAYAPAYHEEMVRKLFISSAVALVHEFHADGLRVDQTTSIHGYNVLHADNRRAVADANIYGAKLLRELSRTLRMIKPDMILMAEDHSTWDEVTKRVEDDGMGFDARWYADFYHHLVGDTNPGSDSYAKLIYGASQHWHPLRMDYFAGALRASGTQRIVYNESHDEAGNSQGPLRDPDWDPNDKDKEFTSHRSIVVAVNGAALVGDTRRYAEARCRFGYGVTVLSAGTPMFLFGEEVGAERRFKYNAVMQNREDVHALRETTGASLFRFYADINHLRRGTPALHSRNIDVVHTSNENRVLAFTRWHDQESILVVASLNDQPFTDGYYIRHPAVGGRFREIFNSDAAIYGGNNIGNLGATVDGDGDGLRVVIPANAVVVLQRL